MVAHAVSHGTNRIFSGAIEDVIVLPRGGARGRRGIVMLPGQLQTVGDYLNPANAGQYAFFKALATAGFPITIIDAQVAGWGNDAAVGDIETDRTYHGTIGCATDKIILVAASAGVTDALNYTRANPSRVKAVIGVMPAVDLDDIRDNNRGSARANINTAWGMPAGSTSATDPLPTRANPNTTTNAALIASSGAEIKLYYSTADTVCVPAAVESFAAKIGITPTIVSTSHDHGDSIFADLDLTAIVRVIEPHL